MRELLDLPGILRLSQNEVATLALATPADAGGLRGFYRAMSAEDRLFLMDDVASAGWLERFLAKLERGEALSVIGKVAGKVRGEGTLHRTLHGWSRHVGEIRLNVARPLRGRGLGLALAGHIVKLATDAGIDKLVAHMVEDQVAARRTFERLGFHLEAELPNQVADLQGKRHALLIYANDVTHIWSAMEGLLADFRPDRASR